MTLYAPLLALGLSLIMIGMVLLILSLKPVQPKHGISGGELFVGINGFIPIIFGGRKMLKFGLIAFFMLSIFIVLALSNPGLIGW